jgi:hypothetical protein
MLSSGLKIIRANFFTPCAVTHHDRITLPAQLKGSARKGLLLLNLGVTAFFKGRQEVFRVKPGTAAMLLSVLRHGMRLEKRCILGLGAWRLGVPGAGTEWR